MNDYWNDPPEEPDLPPCPKCGSAESDIETTGDDTLICQDCDHTWTPKPEPEPLPEIYQEDPKEIAEALTEPAPVKCPHDNPPGECDACDYLADEAYDAARERGGR